MASPFKIPKKKQPAGSDSSPPHMQSPLSRLQSAAPEFKSYGNQCGRVGAAGMHAGNALGSSANRQRVVVKTLLGLNSTNRGAPGANHRASGGWGRQSAPAQIAEPSAGCLSNGWRPKRASDRLLAPSDTSEWPSPPQKKTGASLSVRALDSLAALRGEEHAGSRSSSTWRSVDAPEGKGNAGSSPEPLQQQQQQKNSSLSASDDTSEDDFVSPSRTRNKPPAEHVSPRTPSPRTTPGGRRSLNRTSWLADDPRERERERWREFRERKTWSRLRKPKQAPPEPIVLSSEEEDEGEDDADGGRRTSQGRGRAEQIQEADCGGGLSSGEMPSEEQRAGSSTGGTDEYQLPAPSFLQLDFTSLHAGLTHTHANGKMAITESGITIPLKGDEDGEVTVVASQVRGYGVWDGGVAQGGALLAGWKGPAPSLIFLWVTEAQANLLQTELTGIQTSTAAAGPSCCFLLLVLEEQLQELQAALLASILDMEEYRRGSSSSSGGPTSPLEWTDGLLLLHSCPPPLDQHLLQLLGHSEKSSPVRTNQRTKKSSLDSSALQQLPTRLIQYPAAPSKGRITVTKEDLACLGGGEFLNDVIIDFYLKYLLLEGVGGSVAERSHVFSSFFYKQLSRRRAAGEDAAPSVPDRHMRHQRVKTWTRHVDIFTKDFLFVPVNQEAHWYLVVVCFPGLEEVRYEDFQRPTGGSERAAGPPPLSPRPPQPPQCTLQGWQRDTVLKRPCILVMDSLKLSYHENVCRLLRDYLQVEWEVRRATPRLFSSDSMRSSSCRVPQQDNSSDCGLYLLQYAESFLQNPVVHFDLPLRLDTWFLRQRVRQKREEIRGLIMRMHQSQGAGD